MGTITMHAIGPIAVPVPPPTDPLRELRVNLQLDVRIWGIDNAGKPFSQNARTVEISALGAPLMGVQRVQEGDVIGIQYRQAKARFRIVWIGKQGSEQPGSIGVECVEPGKCIWTEVLEEKAT